MFDLIELLFFAYRDFVGDADRLLEVLSASAARIIGCCISSIASPASPSPNCSTY